MDYFFYLEGSTLAIDVEVAGVNVALLALVITLPTVLVVVVAVVAGIFVRYLQY